MSKWMSKDWVESHLKGTYVSKVNKTLVEIAKKIDTVKDVPSMVSFAKEIIAIKGLKPLDKMVICSLDPMLVSDEADEYVKKLETFDPTKVIVPFHYPSIYINTYGYDEILESLPEDEEEETEEDKSAPDPETTSTTTPPTGGAA